MAGALTRQQEIAIFAKNRRDIAGMQKMEQSLRAGEGSVPQYEETYARRGLSLIKRATGQSDAIHDAQVAKKKAEEAERQKKLSELTDRINKERELRNELASKKINFDEYVTKLEKINPRSAQSERARTVLPSKEKERFEGETDEAYNERMKNVYSQEQRAKDYEEVRQPMKIFPSGSQYAKRAYNPKTGTYYTTHRLTVEEQRKLGVDNPTMEGINEKGELIVVPSPERPEPDMKSEKPTFQSVKQEKEARNKKPESPSSGGNIADNLFNILEMA